MEDNHISAAYCQVHEASEVQSSSRLGITRVTQRAGKRHIFVFDVTLNACFIPFG